MIKYLGELNNTVPENIRVGGNRVKSWKSGYNSEYDIIIISKDGTLGDTYHVSGINIGFPEKPKDRKQILNWDKTQTNQKWKRIEIPDGLTAKTQYDAKYEDYVIEEIRRRDEGVWIYLDGKEIYMTGLSYYFYQWNKLAEGYPNFRVIQNELMIFWEACKLDFRSYGICYVKNRRFGWSSICNAELLLAGTTNENKELGIISQTGGDARKLFGRLIRTFKKLPPFFMPTYDGSTTPKKELLLSKPSRKRRMDEDDDEMEDGLDTSIAYFATTLNSMDGDPVFRSALDEVGKFAKDCPFDQYWGIVKTSHTMGEVITGKSMVGSTVNPMEEGGKEFKEVYDASDPLERTLNGETKSGLYSLFIPAQYGLSGYYDVYGFCILEDPKKPIMNDNGIYKDIGAITYLKNKFDALKDKTDQLNNEMRKYPRTDKEAFRSSSDECSFNVFKIITQSEYNEYESNHTKYGSDEIERGNFTWKDGIQDTEVIWRPNPEGRFWIAKGCHPPLEFRNQKEMIFKNGVSAFAPLAGHIGAAGVDSYNRSKAADGRGSLGAISIQTQYNTSDLPNNAFIVEYLDRAPTVELFFEDALMCLIYYSMPMLAELSNEAFLKMFKNRGYRHYSLNNPFKLYKDLSPTEKELGGAPPQDSKIADQQFYAIESYIENYVGKAEDNSKRPIGTMGFMPFNRTLTQWKDVDLQNRTKYDIYIASSLAALANQRRTLTVKKDEKPRRNPFTQYNNEGLNSIAI